jgi:hypothetical protein
MDSATLPPPAQDGKKTDLDTTPEPFPVAVINIKFLSDGRRTIEAFGPGGSPLGLGRARDILNECLRHYNDLVSTAMIQSEVARKIKEAMQATKDRNLWARLLNVIH